MRRQHASTSGAHLKRFENLENQRFSMHEDANPAGSNAVAQPLRSSSLGYRLGSDQAPKEKIKWLNSNEQHSDALGTQTAATTPFTAATRGC